MTPIDSLAAVAQLVAKQPVWARVLERFGIDYCCGGKLSLQEACAAAGVGLADVVAALQEAGGNAGAAAEPAWTHAPLADLIANILERHHAYLRRELPRLTQLTEKVRAVHGARHAELADVHATYSALRAELEGHMMKEEQVLFPLIRALEVNDRSGTARRGLLPHAIRAMEQEHDSAGAALLRLRTLTGGYAAPEDACNTYRGMLSTLAELEADLHEHIHKENNILFPRALDLEAKLPGFSGDAEPPPCASRRCQR